jgi:hypothetical protein
MAYPFYFFMCFFLVIVQTAIFPLFPILGNFFDLMVPVVVHMGLSRPIRESVPGMFFFGLVMDGLSGAPFGFFLSSYLWLFALVIVLKQVFLVQKIAFLSLISAMGVLIQNGILIAVENLFFPRLDFLNNVVNILWIELVFAVVAGPTMVRAISVLHRRWEQLLRKTFSPAEEDLA